MAPFHINRRNNKDVVEHAEPSNKTNLPFLTRQQQGSRPQGNYRTHHSIQLDEFQRKFLNDPIMSNTMNHHVAANPNSSTTTTSAAAGLSDRLQELLVLEFHKDGCRTQYMHLTVRGLYRYVLNTITDRSNSMSTTAATTTNAAVAMRGHRQYSAFSGLVDNDTTTTSTATTTQPQPQAQQLPTLPFPLTLQDRNASTDAMPLRQARRNRHHVDESLYRSIAVPTSTTTTTAGGIRNNEGTTATTAEEAEIVSPIPGGITTSATAMNNNNILQSPTLSSMPTTANVSPTQHHQHQHHSHHHHTTPAVTYRERLGAYLHPRDMRRLVTPFSTSNEPDLIVRRHVMLLNFDPLRAIILRDRLLVLVPDGADSLLSRLEQRVRGGTIEMENSIFGDRGGTTGSLHGTTHHPASSSSLHHATSSGDNLDSSTTTATSPTMNPPPPCDNTTTTTVDNGGITGTVNGGVEIGSRHRSPLNAFLHPHRSHSGTETNQTSETEPLCVDDNHDTMNHHRHDMLLQHEETGSSSFSLHENHEFEEMKDREWANLSFELQCADAVLHEVGAILYQDTKELRDAAESYMNRVLYGHNNNNNNSAKNGSAWWCCGILKSASFNDDPLTMIRTVKDAVQLMTNRVNGFIKSMDRILDDDEDMALMNLSRLVTHPERFVQPVPQRVLDEESDEPELILEAYLHDAISMLAVLDLVKGRIHSATELIDQKQDAARNRILFANMIISVVTLGVTIAATIGSFFGMNVHNGYEPSDTCDVDLPVCPPPSTLTFKYIVGFTTMGSMATIAFIVAILYYTGTIPHTRHALGKDSSV